MKKVFFLLAGLFVFSGNSILTFALTLPTKASKGICNRTLVVQRELLQIVNSFVSGANVSCDAVTESDLAKITTLNIDYYFPNEPQTVVDSDFKGLDNLVTLYFAQRGAPLKLGAHFFWHTPKLQRLTIINNFLPLYINETALEGLKNLKFLQIQSEIQNASPGLLSHLTSLESLLLEVRDGFPKGFFHKTTKLKQLWISSTNPSDTYPLLPPGIFTGLSNVTSLTLYYKLGRELTPALIQDMHQLETIYAPSLGFSVEALHINNSYRLSIWGNRSHICDESVRSADQNFESLFGGAQRLCAAIGGKFEIGPITYGAYCEKDEEGGFHTSKGGPFICRR